MCFGPGVTVLQEQGIVRRFCGENNSDEKKKKKTLAPQW